MRDILEDALLKIEEKDEIYDVIVGSDQTYPFREAQVIDAMLESFIKDTCDLMVPVIPESRTIWQNSDEVLEQATPITEQMMPADLKEKMSFIGLGGTLY